MEDVIVISIIFGTVTVGMITLGPIGRAIASAIGRKSGAGAAPELAAAVDELADRVAGLQQQVSELAERQDFTERLLAQARERGLLNPPKER